MQRAILMMILCMRSAFPLLAWFLASILCIAPPDFLQNKSTFRCFPLTSLRRTCTRQPNLFSKNVRKSSIFCRTAFSASKKYTAIIALMINGIDHLKIIQPVLKVIGPLISNQITLCILSIGKCCPESCHGYLVLVFLSWEQV